MLDIEPGSGISRRLEQDKCRRIAVNPSAMSHGADFAIAEETRHRQITEVLAYNPRVMTGFSKEALTTPNTRKHQSGRWFTFIACRLFEQLV